MEEGNFEDKYGTDFESFLLAGRLPEDEERDTDSLKQSYNLAFEEGHLPRVYHLGSILNRRIQFDLRILENKSGYRNRSFVSRFFKRKGLRKDLRALVHEVSGIQYVMPAGEYSEMVEGEREYFEKEGRKKERAKVVRDAEKGLFN